MQEANEEEPEPSDDSDTSSVEDPGMGEDEVSRDTDNYLFPPLRISRSKFSLLPGSVTSK